MSTFLDGIASCELIDSSCEVVDLKGLDISSLATTGVLNWEHKNDSANQVIGKIIKARKIYTKKDCSDERETHYWNKCEVPYLYIVGELLDDYTESAKEAAGQLKYSHDHPEQLGILGLSVEGASMPGSKKGVVIGRSIARKVSLTVNPANKMCVAEWMPPQESKVKDDFESIFKTEANIIASFQKGEAIGIYEEFLAKKEETMNKAITLSKPPIPPKAGSPNAFGTRTANPGTQIGTTASGKNVFSHAHVHSYQDFSAQDHKDAAGLHQKAAAASIGNPKMGDKHTEKMRLHNSAANTLDNKEGRFARGKVAAKAKAVEHMGKSESSSAKVGDEVHLHMPNEGEKIKGVVRSVHTKEMGMGGKELGPDDHYAHVELLENGKNKVRHPKGDRYFMSAKHGKKNADGHHITPSDKLEKTLTAGSGDAAPSTLVNGAAYQKESLKKEDKLNSPVFANTKGKDMRAGLPGIKEGAGTSHMGSHVRMAAARPEKASHHIARAKEIASKTLKNKSKWLAKAEEEYQNWEHKGEFESFMKSQMPHLALGEIIALGQAICLKKAVDLETVLEGLMKTENNSPKFEEHPKYKLSGKVKAAALAHHKKNPGAINSIETEDDGGHWLHLKGHTVDNPGQHSWHSDNEEGVLKDIKQIRPCDCKECKQ